MKKNRPWFTPVAPPGALRPVQLILATTAALWMGSMSAPPPNTSTRQSTLLAGDAHTPRNTATLSQRKA